jgi:murein DD-endopeptidase MepM/ murein hydrolase activator NlpD
MHQIEKSFKTQKNKNRHRRRKIRLRRVLFAMLGVLFLSIIGGMIFAWNLWPVWSDGEGNDITVAETTQEPLLEFVPTIVDLPGDPLIISIGQGGDGLPKVRTIATPINLADQRVAQKLHVLADVMLSSSERFMTTLPSRQQDFAFFQAQSGRRQDISSSENAAESSPEAKSEATNGEQSAEGEAGVTEDSAAGWGETLSDGEKALPQFKKTKIENNTSVVETTREVDRYLNTEDFFVRVLSSRTLDSFLIENKISTNDAKLAGETMKSLLKMDSLETGYVVAIRAMRPSAVSTSLQLVQVSIYGKDERGYDSYLGTLALSEMGTYVIGEDPWVRDDLFNYSENQEDSGPIKQYRLLDAVYSTAARNKLSTGLIGETIQLLSRTHDLNAFAEPDDRLIVIYSKQARDVSKNAGRIIYVGVQGPNKNLECFSYRLKRETTYKCVSDQDQVQSVTIRNGMLTPVNGVLTSRFGPRMHPVLKTVRIHKGVDWAAPVGTPVYAAFSGKIKFAGDAGSYGNLVKISHGGGKETRYAHMNRIAQEAKPGRKVKAGDIIGYVGTTGRSTGPHLHFELFRGKRAVDPLGSSVAFASGSGKSADVLVDRIIRIESGGRADAKNPLSSASGLGQFISSTWLKMINRYRPDLAKSLSRQEILNLRFDPTISREMLYKFTYENQAYLRARGHAITPGRLYLAHFLGSEGANIAIRAPLESTVLQVMGSAVVGANPFLKGWDIAKLQNWAERKMSKRGKRTKIASSVTKKKIIRVSAAFKRYKAAVENLVRSVKAVL